MFHHIETVNITPREFEDQVKTWLEHSSQTMTSFKVTARRELQGAGGEYEIDAVAELEILGGASIVVLVECKYYTSAVKRDVVMLLDAKVRDVGAHKGIVFSTAGFQSGALKYARAHGIATVNVVNGDSIYETKDLGPRRKPPPWLNLPPFAGWFLSLGSDDVEHGELLTDDRPKALKTWLNET